MDKIRISRGGSKSPVQLACGDRYDSTLDVYTESPQYNNSVLETVEKQIRHFDHVSTLPSRCLFGKDQYKLHGVLAPGTYAGIWCYNDSLGWHFALFNAKFVDQILKRDDLTDNIMIFPSLKANPSMGGDMQISYVCIHSGGMQSNQSEGCQTIYFPEFAEFSAMWKRNDKVIIELSVVDGYKYPEA